MMNVVKNSIGTKISNKWGDFLCKIAIEAVSKVIDHSSGEPQIDIKRNIRIEKVLLYY
jgi:chaperonin GroEL (HSP60 family)